MANSNLARLTVDRYKSRSTEVAHAMAQSLGQPIDGQEPSREEKARLWFFRAPNVDPSQVAMALASGVIQPAQAVQALFPYRAKLIGSGTPEARVKRAEQLAADAVRWQQEQQQKAMAAQPVGVQIQGPMPVPQPMPQGGM